MQFILLKIRLIILIMRKLLIIIIISLGIMPMCHSREYLYILNDKCINELYSEANIYFKNKPIEVIRDSRGIILRFEIKNPKKEFEKLTPSTIQNIICVKDFLAKNENPAIIEVHTERNAFKDYDNLKNWEVTTIIANNIENFILSDKVESFESRVHSIGYGEFLPSKNTPNNGGNYQNRIDIIVLCNVSGE